MMGSVKRERCVLALEDGTVFVGTAFGGRGTATGEVVFNTSQTGYQEIVTDPSYRRQIVCMTWPQIGNYGVGPGDEESSVVQVSGLAVKELSRCVSGSRWSLGLGGYLRSHGVIGIEGIDTRALTRRVRVAGAMRGVITTKESDPAVCVRLAREAPLMEGSDLVSVVGPRGVSEWREGLGSAASSVGVVRAPVHRIVAIDCGMKRNIARHLVEQFGAVRVVPATASFGEILEMKPGGILVSNGPGDPSAVRWTIETLRQLIGRVPIFGICLGHQLLALALGAKSFKLKFGHRGSNQPVKNLATGRVEITSQNHGFAIDGESLEAFGGQATHVNLNDGTLEGFSHADHALFGVQYHPEASPGPHDATYLFDCFARMVATGRSPTGEDMAAAQFGQAGMKKLGRSRGAVGGLATP